MSQDCLLQERRVMVIDHAILRRTEDLLCPLPIGKCAVSLEPGLGTLLKDILFFLVELHLIQPTYYYLY